MNEVTKFEKKNMGAFQALAFVQQQRKELDAQEKHIKDTLLKSMEVYGITSVNNDIVRISYIPESESVSIDTKALKNEDPDLYHEIENKYNKRVKKKAYVRITVK